MHFVNENTHHKLRPSLVRRVSQGLTGRFTGRSSGPTILLTMNLKLRMIL